MLPSNSNPPANSAINRLSSSVSGVCEWSYDTNTKLYYGSVECCQLREITSNTDYHSFTASLWLQEIHQEDRRRLESELQSLYSGEIENLSIRYRTRDKINGWKWILTRATVSAYNFDKKPETVYGVDIDITELYEDHRDNKLLREEAKRSEIALASAQQGLWHVDFRRNIRTESDTWRTMRGYPADSNYGPCNGWHADIHPDDIDRVINQIYISALETHDDIDYTYRQRHANGEWRWIWSRGKIIERDSRNQPLVLIGTDTDITHIKESETTLKKLSNTLEIAIQAAGMGVWEWTLNSKVNIWDRRTQEIFGTHSDSKYVSSDRFMELLHPDDREEFTKTSLSAVQEGRDIIVDYRINHPQKGIRYIKAKAQCLMEDGESTRYVGFVWDITDMIHAEQERSALAEKLSHAQRLQSIGELTGGVAHDFNNLLAVITGNAELLSMTSSGQSKYLNAILSASQRGAELTRGLLAFSRKQALKPTSIDLRELIGDVTNMLDRTLGSTISINITIADNLWCCEADPTQLENALINLIVNARDAMPEGGSISIGTENIVIDSAFASLAPDVIPGDFVKLSISDSGIGMPKAILSKSIDPFFTTKASGDGHGLGLSMVFGFIKQSNGHLTIDSVLSKGTVVSLYLPRNSGIIQQPINEKSVPGYLPTGHGETILLVEDDKSVQEMINKSLEFLGYKTVCVNSGAEALRKIAQLGSDIDLVVSDIVLSKGMNGFELGHIVATQYPGTRMVYISGYAQGALKKQSDQFQNVEILEKPFSVDKLATHIAMELQESHSKVPG